MKPPPEPLDCAQSRARFPVAVMAFLWGLLVFARYFFGSGHPVLRFFPAVGEIFDPGAFPPVPAGQAFGVMGRSFRILLAGLVISGATWSLGCRVRRWLSFDLGDSWVRFGFDFGLGAVGLDLFWIGTGLTRLWYPPLWEGAGGLCALAFLKDGFLFLKQKPFRLPSFSYPRQAGTLVLVLAGLFYWAFSVLQDLAPETFYDSMVYHLAVPRYWLFHHGLADFPTQFFSNYPFGGETYFLNGLVLQGTETAKLLHAVCFGACALLAGGWAREAGGERAGWLTLGLTLTLPVFALATWTTAVEGFLALALLLFTYALHRFFSKQGGGFPGALTAGLFAGLAFSTKYTALLGLAAVLGVFLFQTGKALRERWRFFPPALAGAGLLAAPWILKNLAYTGNPFFPYFTSLFPGRHLPAAGYESLLREQHGWVAHTVGACLALPWTLTMASPDSYNFCGPLALAVFPLLFLFRLRNPSLRFIAPILPLFFASSLAVTHVLRFLLLGFILLYVLIGAVLAGGDRPGWAKGVAWAAALSSVLCFTYLAAVARYYYDCVGIWTGRQTRAEYMSGPGKITPYYAMAQWIGENLPRDSHLLIVGDARGLYYDRPFLTNSVFDEQVLARLAREEKDGEGVGRRLKELGVDYLAVNGPEGIRVSAQYHSYDLAAPEWGRLDDFMQRGTALVYQSGLQGVYRILPALQTRAPAEVQDLVLFFSKPASQFILDVQKHRWQEAESDILETTRLYPFSRFWKGQRAQFEKQVGPALGL